MGQMRRTIVSWAAAEKFGDLPNVLTRGTVQGKTGVFSLVAPEIR